jgi:transposase
MAKRRKGLSMRKVGEIFRLSMVCQKTHRQIARSLSISHTAVNEYLRQAGKAGLTYEQIQAMQEDDLKVLLKSCVDESQRQSRSEPDWAKMHEELKKPSVTLRLLWEEYKEAHPEGYQLSRFCELFRRWRGKLNVSLRQTHKAGEKMFVDYAGQ